MLNNGEFYTSNFDVNNHYEDNIRVLEKYDPHKVWTAVLYDADQQGYPYIKRFCFEASNRKQNYLGENKDSRLILLTAEYYPRHCSERFQSQREATDYLHTGHHQ